MIRAFLALRLADPAPREIASVATRLAESLGLTATATDDLHVTLKFLGEIDEAAADRLFDLAAQSVARIPAELTFDQLTALPHDSRASVLVLEATRVPEALVALVGEVDAAAAALGVAAERREYRPHVTLLRLRPPRTIERHPRVAPVVARVRSLTLCETLPRGSPLHYADRREATISTPPATTS